MKNNRFDGKIIRKQDKECPHLHCGKQYARILEHDADIALLECPDGHQWSAVKEGSR